MKKQDLILIGFCLLLFLPFILSSALYNGYITFNARHGMTMAALKFGILSTLGEVIGLRIRTGCYNLKGFGILPRTLVWAVLGMWINMSFKIFGAGAPLFAEYLGISGTATAMLGSFSLLKLVGALFISTSLNITFAPVFMTLHKVIDAHIVNNGGTFRGFFRPIRFASILQSLNWDIQWSFVFKKTIPFFWIPAHTVTFLLPTDFQILVAALLGVALGILLAIASQKGK
ncbi:MAG: hypothetical protein LBL90_09100 [Prevotellaceae bacterium]|jgi:hypothetical protein|nr:hypothetical protein [Prevotellaceae bacterium]